MLTLYLRCTATFIELLNLIRQLLEHTVFNHGLIFSKIEVRAEVKFRDVFILRDFLCKTEIDQLCVIRQHAQRKSESIYRLTTVTTTVTVNQTHFGLTH